MNDRQIECFLEAGRLLNFTRAAENLLLPQPAVSRYISALENELGVQLFLRENSRKVVLTEAGKAYYNLFQRTYIPSCCPIRTSCVTPRTSTASTF